MANFPAAYGKGKFGYCHKPSATTTMMHADLGLGSMQVHVDPAHTREKGLGIARAHPPQTGLHGSFDSVLQATDGSVTVGGWAVDWGLQGPGRDPVEVHVMVDNSSVYAALANVACSFLYFYIKYICWVYEHKMTLSHKSA